MRQETTRILWAEKGHDDLHFKEVTLAPCFGSIGTQQLPPTFWKNVVIIKIRCNNGLPQMMAQNYDKQLYSVYILKKWIGFGDMLVVEWKKSKGLKEYSLKL